jgi:hypothetical protein
VLDRFKSIEQEQSHLFENVRESGETFYQKSKTSNNLDELEDRIDSYQLENKGGTIHVKLSLDNNERAEVEVDKLTLTNLPPVFQAKITKVFKKDEIAANLELILKCVLEA